MSNDAAVMNDGTIHRPASGNHDSWARNMAEAVSGRSHVRSSLALVSAEQVRLDLESINSATLFVKEFQQF